MKTGLLCIPLLFFLLFLSPASSQTVHSISVTATQLYTGIDLTFNSTTGLFDVTNTGQQSVITVTGKNEDSIDIKVLSTNPDGSNSVSSITINIGSPQYAFSTQTIGWVPKKGGYVELINNEIAESPISEENAILIQIYANEVALQGSGGGGSKRQVKETESQVESLKFVHKKGDLMHGIKLGTSVMRGTGALSTLFAQIRAYEELKIEEADQATRNYAKRELETTIDEAEEQTYAIFLKAAFGVSVVAPDNQFIYHVDNVALDSKMLTPVERFQIRLKGWFERKGQKVYGRAEHLLHERTPDVRIQNFKRWVSQNEDKAMAMFRDLQRQRLARRGSDQSFDVYNKVWLEQFFPELANVTMDHGRGKRAQIYPTGPQASLDDVLYGNSDPNSPFGATYNMLQDFGAACTGLLSSGVLDTSAYFNEPACAMAGLSYVYQQVAGVAGSIAQIKNVLGQLVNILGLQTDINGNLIQVGQNLLDMIKGIQTQMASITGFMQGQGFVNNDLVTAVANSQLQNQVLAASQSRLAYGQQVNAIQAQDNSEQLLSALNGMTDVAQQNQNQLQTMISQAIQLNSAIATRDAQTVLAASASAVAQLTSTVNTGLQDSKARLDSFATNVVSQFNSILQRDAEQDDHVNRLTDAVVNLYKAQANSFSLIIQSGNNPLAYWVAKKFINTFENGTMQALVIDGTGTPSRNLSVYSAIGGIQVSWQVTDPVALGTQSNSTAQVLINQYITNMMQNTTQLNVQIPVGLDPDAVKFTALTSNVPNIPIGDPRMHQFVLSFTIALPAGGTQNYLLQYNAGVITSVLDTPANRASGNTILFYIATDNATDLAGGAVRDGIKGRVYASAGTYYFKVIWAQVSPPSSRKRSLQNYDEEENIFSFNQPETPELEETRDRIWKRDSGNATSTTTTTAMPTTTTTVAATTSTTTSAPTTTTTTTTATPTPTPTPTPTLTGTPYFQLTFETIPVNLTLINATLVQFRSLLSSTSDMKLSFIAETPLFQGNATMMIPLVPPVSVGGNLPLFSTDPTTLMNLLLGYGPAANNVIQQMTFYRWNPAIPPGQTPITLQTQQQTDSTIQGQFGANWTDPGAPASRKRHLGKRDVTNTTVCNCYTGLRRTTGTAGYSVAGYNGLDATGKQRAQQCVRQQQPGCNCNYMVIQEPTTAILFGAGGFTQTRTEVNIPTSNALNNAPTFTYTCAGSSTESFTARTGMGTNYWFASIVLPYGMTGNWYADVADREHQNSEWCFSPSGSIANLKFGMQLCSYPPLWIPSQQSGYHQTQNGVVPITGTTAPYAFSNGPANITGGAANGLTDYCAGPKGLPIWPVIPQSVNGTSGPLGTGAWEVCVDPDTGSFDLGQSALYTGFSVPWYVVKGDLSAPIGDGTTNTANATYNPSSIHILFTIPTCTLLTFTQCVQPSRQGICQNMINANTSSFTNFNTQCINVADNPCNSTWNKFTCLSFSQVNVFTNVSIPVCQIGASGSCQVLDSTTLQTQTVAPYPTATTSQVYVPCQFRVALYTSADNSGYWPCIYDAFCYVYFPSAGSVGMCMPLANNASLWLESTTFNISAIPADSGNATVWVSTFLGVSVSQCSPAAAQCIVRTNSGTLRLAYALNVASGLTEQQMSFMCSQVPATGTLGFCPLKFLTYFPSWNGTWDSLDHQANTLLSQCYPWGNACGPKCELYQQDLQSCVNAPNSACLICKTSMSCMQATPASQAACCPGSSLTVYNPDSNCIQAGNLCGLFLANQTVGGIALEFSTDPTQTVSNVDALESSPCAIYAGANGIGNLTLALSDPLFQNIILPSQVAQSCTAVKSTTANDCVQASLVPCQSLTAGCDLFSDVGGQFDYLMNVQVSVSLFFIFFSFSLFTSHFSSSSS
jgi:hypothetical protein